MCNLYPDSPSIPPSAIAHEIFRGFSYIAPVLVEEMTDTSQVNSKRVHVVAQVSIHRSLKNCTHSKSIYRMFYSRLLCILYFI